jgi:Flp pilus assembly protein TadG
VPVAFAQRISYRQQAGQAAVFLVLALVPLLAMVGFVIDIGYAYYAQRSLQASADAAALAGAQDLPDPGVAANMARAYGAKAGAKNHNDAMEIINESISTKCIASVPGCNPANAVVVKETARVSTKFARVIGVDTITLHVGATACSPCGVKPLDVMLVLDRTGSMCQTHSGASDPSCTDLNNARAGMKSFLTEMDPSKQWVGLAVFPPATSLSNKCATPQTSNYDSTSSPYTVVPLSKDYAVNGVLQTSSNLVSTINCVKGNGSTAYANAIEKAQGELDLHGRSDVQDVIVFFSDGAANTGPTYYSTSSPYRKQPCHQGVTSAGASKARRTLVYSIGYDLNALDGGANRCQASTGPNEAPAITAYQALQQIATDSSTFYNQPSAGDVRAIFLSVAADIRRGSAALVDDNKQ